jgi:hypothetical protein
LTLTKQTTAGLFEGDPLTAMVTLAEAGDRAEAWVIYHRIHSQAGAILDMLRDIAQAIEAEGNEERAQKARRLVALGEMLAGLTGEAEMVGMLTFYEGARQLCAA